MNKELYEKNLQGLETFKKLSLEERLKFLCELGILEKEQDRYKLSKEYTGELNKEETDFDKKIKKCPLCSTGKLQSTYVYLENQTLKAYGCNKCSYSFWEPQIDTKTYTISTSGTTSDFDKKMKECHQYGLCVTLKEKPEGIFSVCRNCPLKKDKE